MENIICLDSSPLIDFYRKKNKEKTFFYRLSSTYHGFILPVTAHFKILLGNNQSQHSFWQNMFSDLLIIPYQPSINQTAIFIVNYSKTKRRTINFKDLLIAATALYYNYSLATLNEKHFLDIERLHLITPSSFLS